MHRPPTGQESEAEQAVLSLGTSQALAALRAALETPDSSLVRCALLFKALEQGGTFYLSGCFLYGSFVKAAAAAAAAAFLSAGVSVRGRRRRCEHLAF